MPYTYLIGWSNFDKWYYGCRYAKNSTPEDLMTSYLTSSRTVKKFIDENGPPDVIQIRRVFNDPIDARLWESKVLDRLNAARNSKMLNKRNGSWKWCFDEMSDCTRKKISSKLKGRKKSPESILKRLESTKGLKRTPEQREAQSQRLRGIERPQSFKEKIRLKKWINDGTNHKRIHISQDLPHGWHNGRIITRKRKRHEYQVTVRNSNIEYTTYMSDFVHENNFKRENIPSLKPGQTINYKGWSLYRPIDISP